MFRGFVSVLEVCIWGVVRHWKGFIRYETYLMGGWMGAQKSKRANLLLWTLGRRLERMGG